MEKELNVVFKYLEEEEKNNPELFKSLNESSIVVLETENVIKFIYDEKPLLISRT